MFEFCIAHLLQLSLNPDVRDTRLCDGAAVTYNRKRSSTGFLVQG